MKPSALCFSALCLVVPAASAFAQEEPKPTHRLEGSAGASVGADASTPADPAAGEAPKADPNAAPTATTPDGKPVEAAATDEEAKRSDPNKTKYYLGARFRDFIVPGFIFRWFADGGPSAVNVFSGGPELMVQMGPLEVITSVTVPYADYSMDEFVFKSKDDPDQAYEIVSSSLKLIGVSVDLLGRIPIDKKGTVAFLIGGGVGISGVIGDIRRTQAYPDNPANIDPRDPGKWHKCSSPNDPPVTTPDGHAYCGNDNDHYPTDDGDPDTNDDWKETSWTDGGSKPIVWPYLALPHMALEVTPIEELMIRLDAGFSISGFFVGLGAGGKLPI